MFSNISYKNFKAFEEVSLDLKPITLLLGPNNSGKSSIISGLRILSQTVKSYDNNVPLLLNGEMGEFGSYKDIVFKNSKRRNIEVKFSVQPDEYHKKYLNVKQNQTIGFSMKYSYRTKIQELILNEFSMSKDNSVLIRSMYSDDSERQSVNFFANKQLPQSIMGTISKRMRMKNFLPIRFINFLTDSIDSQMDKFGKLIEKTSIDISRTTHYLQDILEGMEYVGAMRVPPSRMFLYSGERRQRVGANGENSINILAMDSLRKGSRSKGILNNVIEWLNSAGIASDVKVEKLSDRYYEIHFQHPETKEYQNFADVGYGNSQVVPILVAGFNLSDESVFLVEEPEIHLHPRAQAELGNFFLNLYKRNIQSIVETHSEHLVLRLQQLVANGDISNTDVVFYYIYANNGRKNAVRLNLDEKGRFVEEWPEGFFPERLEEAKKLSKIRHKQEE